MIKFLTLLAAAWMLCVSLPVSAAGSHVALFKSVSGSVTITQGGTARQATIGTHLHVADRVVAAPGATAAIVFKDGTMLTLGAGGDIVVRDYVFEPKATVRVLALHEQGSAV